MSIHTDSTANIPLIFGSLEIMGQEKKNLILMKDYHNNVLASAEIIPFIAYQALTDKGNYREVLFINEDKKKQRVFVKKNTLNIHAEVFKEWAQASLRSKAGEDAFFDHVNKYQGLDRYEHLNAMKMAIPVSVGAKGSKNTINRRLNRTQIFEVVSEIEKNKEVWIQEANNLGRWIKKTILITDEKLGTIKVTVEVYPNTRQRVGDLGQIDIKMKLIGKGSLKSVNESFNYERNTVTAGLYAKMFHENDRTSTEIDTQQAILASIDPTINPSEKKQFALSKAIDFRHPSTPPKAYVKVKFTQSLYREGSLLEVLLDEKLPNGTPLDSRMKKLFYIDLLKALKHMHKLKIVHRDVKSENVMIKYSKKLGRYVAKLSDFDLSTKKNNGLVAGTPPYAAPEIILNKDFDHRADLYSLGKALCFQPDPWWYDNGKTYIPNNMIIEDYLNTGQSPFFEPEDKNTYQWFSWKLTHPDVNQRFQSAAEALAYLEKLPDPVLDDLDLGAEMLLVKNVDLVEHMALTRQKNVNLLMDADKFPIKQELYTPDINLREKENKGGEPSAKRVREDGKNS
ncbi:MAG: protein kinase [Parachlamydiales bacterium]|jgi:serine/threonine protein kinase